MKAEENKKMLIIIFLYWREIAFQILFETKKSFC